MDELFVRHLKNLKPSTVSFVLVTIFLVWQWYAVLSYGAVHGAFFTIAEHKINAITVGCASLSDWAGVGVAVTYAKELVGVSGAEDGWSLDQKTQFLRMFFLLLSSAVLGAVLCTSTAVFLIRWTIKTAAALYLSLKRVLEARVRQILDHMFLNYLQTRKFSDRVQIYDTHGGFALGHGQGDE